MITVQQVTRLSLNGLPRDQEVRFWGLIAGEMYFIVSGTIFTANDYLGENYFSVGGPARIRDENERHDLFLYIGKKEQLSEKITLKEIPLIECEYYPFSNKKPAKIRSKNFDFLFPNNSVFAALYEENRKEIIHRLDNGSKRFVKKDPTCNGIRIDLFNPEALNGENKP